MDAPDLACVPLATVANRPRQIARRLRSRIDALPRAVDTSWIISFPRSLQSIQLTLIRIREKFGTRHVCSVPASARLFPSANPTVPRSKVQMSHLELRTRKKGSLCPPAASLRHGGPAHARDVTPGTRHPA